MSKSLTIRQKEILEFIERYLNEHGYPPTIKEIGDHFEISLKGSYDHIKALEKKKYIAYKPKTRRSIKLLVYSNESENHSESSMREIPLLGFVQAGMPVLSYENFEGKIKIDENLFIGNELFGLRIRGDSMVDEGIYEGDIAIVKCKNFFDNGEIIVVDTGNGVTIKKGYKEKTHLRLEAANKNYSTIITSKARIIGKLVGLIRNYQ